ncbi:ABC transporter permease [Pollutibacter soli]|uniref:ABC transporter permease n=1 Tax=Pollutibacter soli TaxID=3034157 RepID=UPI003013453C
MNNIIKTEWLKIKSYRAFWWVIGITALSYPGINYIFYTGYLELTKNKDAKGQLAKALIGNPFAFPEVFHTAAYFSSFFVFIPGIVVIMLITNEYNFKTHRQNIIDGWSRKQFLTGKLFDVAFITVLISVIFFIVAMAIGLNNTPADVTDKFSQVKYVGLFGLQTFSQLSIAFLIGFIIRRSFIALSVFVFYFLILENIAEKILRFKANDIGRFFPLEISDRMIPIVAFLGKFDEKGYQKAVDAIGMHVILTLIVTAIVWLVCYTINKRRDL